MVRRVLLAAGALALLATPLASASDYPQHGDERAGIENARSAGIEIDPAAEDAMASAPIGTCANDPTLPQCPPARAVVFVEPDENGDYSLTPPPSQEDTLDPHNDSQALAAPNNCNLRGGDPYKAAGYAQGDANNDCYSTPSVSRQELYGTLYKRIPSTGNWEQMVTRSDTQDSNGRVEVHPRHRCASGTARSWTFRASAYVYWRGTWYATTRQWGDRLYCT
jgi:hypothetical protein